MNPIDRQILQIALPSIVSNITVPLLGLIDVAIVGHLGSPAYIGAIAVGGMLFNIIYWIFGFLRMGTSGMTSQAYGKRDLPEIVRLLIRSVGIGLAVALCLILLQVPIRQAAFQIIRPTEEVREMATLYFHICIWGAGAIRTLRVVHRYAELPHSHVHSHYAEHCQHHGKPQPCLFLRDESGRRSLGNTDCPICGFSYGAGTMDEPLRQTEEVYRLERSASKRGNDTLFPSEPRHFPADIVSGSRYVILYLGRSLAR